MVHAMLGPALRLTAARAKRQGKLTDAQVSLIHQTIRKPVKKIDGVDVNLMEELQTALLEEAVVRGLAPEGADPTAEIDIEKCKELMDMLMKYLPMIMALFGM